MWHMQQLVQQYHKMFRNRYSRRKTIATGYSRSDCDFTYKHVADLSFSKRLKSKC